MTLTPLDIDKLEFKVAFRGYAREEVEQFLAEASRTLEDHIAEAARLKARIAELEQDVARFRENEDVVKNSMVLAQRTCDELIAAAHQRADAIRQQVEAEGEQTRRQFTELKSMREEFEYAFYGLLTGFIKRLEHGNPALGGYAPVPISPSAAAPASPPVLPRIAPQLDLRRAATPAEPGAIPSAAAESPAAGRDHDLADFLTALERGGTPPATPPESES